MPCQGHRASLLSLASIQSKHCRIKEEESTTEARLLRAQQKVNEALSTLMRLRNQKNRLRARGIEMVQKGVNSLDELDKLIRLEEEQKKVAAKQAQLSSILQANPFNWSAPGGAWLDDPAFSVSVG